MSSYLFLLFFLSTIFLHLLPISAQPTYRAHICLNTGNYTTNSTYQKNLKNLLSSLPPEATTINNGFYNTTAGQHADTVYSLFLCRGDVSPDICRRCINASSQDVIQQCPKQKEALIWYDECMFRYSNRSIFSRMEERPFTTLWNRFNILIPEQFEKVVGTLIDSLVRRVASGSSRAMFATAEANYTVFETVYGLVQCTPDISLSACNKCLKAAIKEIPNCCAEMRGGRILMPSCNLRYETSPFYDIDDDKFASSPSLTSPPLPQPLPPSRISNRGERKLSPRVIIAIIVSTVTTVILVFIIWFLLQRRKPQEEAKFVDEIRSLEYLQFGLETIRASTNDFSDANKLGEGGYGAVYKGRLWNGQDIAVKRLSGNSQQGDEEFKNEVFLLAKLHHRNLVRLLGFCSEEEEKLLIYEFLPNKSLDHFIFDPEQRAELEWESRYKIIQGIVRGLLYLHEDSRLRIIHRDLKASNILLDADMDTKISDFGMARLFLMDQSQGKTNHIVGTYAYMAPEYVMHGQYSIKSDVFSFGVLLLEIISSKRNIKSECSEDLLSYVWRKWGEGRSIDIVDQYMRDNCSSMAVMRCIHIGLLCVQENVADRPTMALVDLMMNCESFTLPSPSQPAFFVNRIINMLESDQSKSESAPQSINEASITELYPR